MNYPTSSTNLIFIDTNVSNYQSLIPDTSNNAVILLNSQQDGIEQITEALENYRDLDSISIISHGEAGSVQLGNTYLSSSNLDGYKNDLEAWGEALSSDGDLLFYSCNVGANIEGSDFVNKIANITDADVAASDDLTGNIELGGDWVLEVVTGKIETPTFASNAYSGVLELVVNKDIDDNFQFNGTDTRVKVSHNNALNITEEITLSARINPNSFDDWDGIVVKGKTNAPYAMQLSGDGSLRFTANARNPLGGVGSGSWDSHTKISANQWSDVAVTYDGTSLRFYINGQLDSNVVTTNLTFGTNDEKLFIGADLPGKNEFFEEFKKKIKILHHEKPFRMLQVWT